MKQFIDMKKLSIISNLFRWKFLQQGTCQRSILGIGGIPALLIIHIPTICQ